MPDNEFNKTYLILGASSDLGTELVSRLNEESPSNEKNLFIAHYNSSKEKLESIAMRGGNKLVCVKADLSDMGAVDNLIEETKKMTDAPTHIVHLAAPPFNYMRLKDFSRDALVRSMDIQVCSFAKVAQAFLPVMAKRKRHDKIVVMLTSYVLDIPPKFMVDYITVKHALLGLTKSLAADYTGKGVNINAVSPSMIETKFLKNIDERIVQMAAEESPEKRNATPADIVPVIQFLLSDAANYMHGTNVSATCGGR